MKYLVVMVIALAAFVAADEQRSAVTDKDILHKIHDDCIKESGVTAEQIEKINNLQHPDEKEVREYTRCFVKKIGVFTDDNGYNLDSLMSQFSVFFADVEQIRDIVTGCVDHNEQKSTLDEWAYRGTKCLLDSKIGDSVKASKKSA